MESLSPSSPATLWAHHGAQHRAVMAESLATLGDVVAQSAELLADALVAGGKVIAFGNGGSAAQASHLAGELMGRFDGTRTPLPALALPADAGVATCIGNDFGYDALFARQVQALVRPGDVALGLTTSGTSRNVLNGLTEAHRQGATTIALTGAGGLHGDVPVDCLIAVPSDATALVQEVHLLILHVWCQWIDHVITSA
jgi:D-sedoheptulose 7-phosphate isomerase